MTPENAALRTARTVRRIGDRALFWMVCASAFLVFIAGSWVPSYWYDEAATLQLARLSIPDMFAFVGQRDAVHVAYALLMHGWIGIFGESELSARMPSVLASALATGGIMLLVRRLGGARGPAVFAAVLFALLPRTLIQAIEARSYAIAVALLVAAALLAVRSADRATWGARIGFTVTATAAIWCFAYAVLVLPALGLLMARRAVGMRRRMTIAVVSILPPTLLALPLLLTITGQRGQVAWLEAQLVNPYTVGVESFFGWSAWLAGGVIALLVAGAVRRSLRWNGDTVALVVWLVLPAAALILVGAVSQPLFAPRYLAISTPPLAVLCALAVRGWSSRALVAAGLAWVIAATPIGVSSRMPAAKPSGIDLRAVAMIIHDGGRSGDGFLLGADGTGALRPRVALAAYPDAFRGMKDLALAQSYVETGTYWDAVRMPSAAELAAVPRVWTATRGDDPFSALLERAGFTASSSTVVTGVEVALWTR